MKRVLFLTTGALACLALFFWTGTRGTEQESGSEEGIADTAAHPVDPPLLRGSESGGWTNAAEPFLEPKVSVPPLAVEREGKPAADSAAAVQSTPAGPSVSSSESAAEAAVLGPADPEMAPSEAAATFRGRVQDTQGRPVEGAAVKGMFADGRPSGWEDVTDAEGYFAWDSKLDSPVQFHVSRDGFRPYQTQPKPPGGDEFLIVLTQVFHLEARVVDSASGEPVENFTVIPGESFRTGSAVDWDRRRQFQGRQGRFDYQINQRGGYRSIAIEAAGYAPAISPRWRAPGSYEHRFELSPGSGWTGRVEQPNGEPIAGAALFLAVPYEKVWLSEQGDLHSSVAGPVFSKVEGRFTFQPRFQPSRILASHSTGFAEVPFVEFEAKRRIVMRPWAHVEGVVQLNRSLEATPRILMEGDSKGRTLDPLEVTFASGLSSDGQFAFHRVPPGRYRLMLEYRFQTGDAPVTRVMETVSVEAGETFRVELGGEGREVRGQVVVVGENPGELNWRRDIQKLRLKKADPGATGEERREYPLLFEADGSFRIHDVVPGEYELEIEVKDSADQMGRNRILGRLIRDVVVPAAAPEAEQPVDLGVIELEIKERGKGALVTPIL